MDVDRKEMEQDNPPHVDSATREVSHDTADGVMGSSPLADSKEVLSLRKAFLRS